MVLLEPDSSSRCVFQESLMMRMDRIYYWHQLQEKIAYLSFLDYQLHILNSKINRPYFQSSFKFIELIETWNRQYREFPYPSQDMVSPCIGVAHLLQLINQYRHIIINVTQFLIGFTLCGTVFSLGFDKCKMSCMHHYNMIQQFHCTKNPLCSTFSSLLGIYPNELNYFVHTKTCACMFIGALFIIAPN